MGRHAQARKTTNVPRGRRPVDQPEEVDEEPTRVDAERPLNRLEDLAETPMRWGRQPFPAGGRRGTGLVGGTMAHA